VEVGVVQEVGVLATVILLGGKYFHKVSSSVKLARNLVKPLGAEFNALEFGKSCFLNDLSQRRNAVRSAGSL